MSVSDRADAKTSNHYIWTAVALFFMLGFLAGLGLRVYAGHQTTRFHGPDHLVASEDRVYVHANGYLFVLDSSGKTLKHFKLSDALLTGGLIDLRLMPDGRLLIAEQMPANIHLCNAEHFDCATLNVPLSETLSRQYKVLPDTRGEQLFVTDSTRGGALYRIDIADRSITPVLNEGLSFANDIQYGPDQDLIIADSFNRRIVSVHVDSETTKINETLFETNNDAIHADRDWPMMLQSLGNGEWAVTQPTGTGGKADLLIYKANKELPERLTLKEDLDPTDLTMVDGRVLVSDIGNFSLYTVDTSSGEVEPWGGLFITKWLKEQKQERDAYQHWVDLGLALMLACAPFMLIAGYFGTSREKRMGLFATRAAPSLVASDEEPPVLSSIYWLKRNPKMDRLFRWMMPAMTVLLVLLLLTLGYVLYALSGELDIEKFREEVTVFLVFAALMVGMLPLMYINMDMLRGQLGADGKRIFVRLPNGGQSSAMPGQMVYTKNFIHFGTHTVSIGNRKNQALYEEGEIETYIAPLLKYGRKVNFIGLFRQQLQDGEYGQIYTLLYAISATAGIIYLEFGDKLKGFL